MHQSKGKGHAAVLPKGKGNAASRAAHFTGAAPRAASLDWSAAGPPVPPPVPNQRFSRRSSSSTGRLLSKQTSWGTAAMKLARRRGNSASQLTIYDRVYLQRDHIFPSKYFGDLVELLEKGIDDGTISTKLQARESRDVRKPNLSAQLSFQMACESLPGCGVANKTSGPCAVLTSLSSGAASSGHSDAASSNGVAGEEAAAPSAAEPKAAVEAENTSAGPSSLSERFGNAVSGFLSHRVPSFQDQRASNLRAVARL